MPTRGRKDFVAQSVSYFQRQAYPNRELLILDDSEEPYEKFDWTSGSIRYFHLRSTMSIGEKRNLGCDVSRGSFIAQWDDDDWYGPSRLARQLEPLLEGSRDICGLGGGTIFDIRYWEFWNSPYAGRVLEGTLVFRREVWEELARYPEQSFGECGAFLADATRMGATLRTIPGEGLFFYVLHGGNASLNPDIRHYPRAWSRISEPTIPVSDRSFYLSRQSVD